MMNLSFFKVQVIFPLFTLLLSVFLIGYFLLKGRKTKLLYTYILLQMIIVIWSTGQAWEMLSDNQQSRWLAIIFTVLGWGYAGFGWLLFCGFYTGNRIITKKSTIYLLLIPPTLSFLCLLTNNYHHLFITTITLGSVNNHYGIVYWFLIATVYLYILTGIILMIKYTIHQFSMSRNQSILLIASALIPFLADILVEYDIYQGAKILKGFDITLYSLSLSLLLFGIVSYKYRFLNIIPVGWQKIMNHMKESMVIIDRTDKIVNYNHSFADNFPEFIQTGTDDLIAFTQQLSNRCDDRGESNRMITAIQYGTIDVLSGELTLIAPEWRCFSVYIHSIFSKRGEIQGRIVLLNDITHDKKLLQELHHKNTAMAVMNQELAAANEQLKDYAQTVEELTLSQERNRIARDIHDTLGHTMTLSLALLEVSIILCEQNPTAAKVKLLEATRITKDGIKELRRSIRQKTEVQDLLDSLRQLIANFESSGLRIDFSVEGGNDYLQPQYSEVIFRLCQEALTNTLRHGKAKRAVIILNFENRGIKLYIFDDGQGCKTITKGMGLTGMEERVKELKGTIEYGSSGESGFNINVEIPLI